MVPTTHVAADRESKTRPTPSGRGIVRVLVGPLMVAALVAFPFTTGNDSMILTVSTIFMWAILASSFNLISGFTGYVDFGHGVHFGIGGYVTGILMSRHGFAFWETIPVTIVVCAVFAALVGWPLLRIRGIYFSIAMLGVFLSVHQLSFLVPKVTNGARGLILPGFVDRHWFYNMFLIGAVVVLLLSWWLRRSQFGASLLAIREDEDGALARGINTTALKLSVFCLASTITGVVGSFWAYQATFIDPDIMFREDFIISLGVMATLGGLGVWWGPALGALVYLMIQDQIWSNQSGGGFLVFFGLVLIVLVLFLPEGIAGVALQGQRTMVGRLIFRMRRRWFGLTDKTERFESNDLDRRVSSLSDPGTDEGVER